MGGFAVANDSGDVGAGKVTFSGCSGPKSIWKLTSCIPSNGQSPWSYTRQDPFRSRYPPIHSGHTPAHASGSAGTRHYWSKSPMSVSKIGNRIGVRSQQRNLARWIQPTFGDGLYSDLTWTGSLPSGPKGGDLVQAVPGLLWTTKWKVSGTNSGSEAASSEIHDCWDSGTA